MSHSDKFKIEIILGTPVAVMGAPMYLDSLLGAVNHGVHHLSMSERGAPMGSQFFLEYRDNKMVNTAFSKKVDLALAYREEACQDGLLQKGKLIGASPKEGYAVGTGQLKNYGGGEKIESQWITKAVAWGVGDKSKVEALLKNVHNFGPKARLGFGHVLFINVIKDDKAEENWRYRVLPEAEPVNDDDYCPILSPITGPYWNKSNEVAAKIYIGTPSF